MRILHGKDTVCSIRTITCVGNFSKCIDFKFYYVMLTICLQILYLLVLTCVSVYALYMNKEFEFEFALAH